MSGLSHRALWLALLLVAAPLPSWAQDEEADSAEETDGAGEEERARPARPPAAFGQGVRAFRDGNYTDAATQLEQVLGDPGAAAFHAEAHYWSARALERLELPLAALDHYSRFFAEGGESDEWDRGFENGVALAENVDGGWLLAAGLAEHPSSRFATGASAAALFWIGEMHFERGRWAEAAAYLQSVPSGSRYYPRAQLMQGIAMTQQGRPGEALPPFLMAAASEDGSITGENVAELANLNLARTYYALGEYERAMTHYEAVPRSSSSWYQSLFERAWTHLMQSDFDGALGEIQSINAPFFDELYHPEASLLRVLVYFFMCKYVDGARLIDEFTERHRPLLEELNRAIDRGEADPAGLYRQLVGFVIDGEGGDDIPAPIRQLYVTNRSVERSGQFLRQVEREQERLGRIRGGFGDSAAGRRTARILEARTEELLEREGERVVATFQTQAEELQAFLGSAIIYKLEMTDREGTLYQAIANGQVPDEVLRREASADVPEGFRYWPFEGEYWLDEIGWYQVRTLDECTEVLGLDPYTIETARER